LPQLNHRYSLEVAQPRDVKPEYRIEEEPDKKTKEKQLWTDTQTLM